MASPLQNCHIPLQHIDRSRKTKKQSILCLQNFELSGVAMKSHIAHGLLFVPLASYSQANEIT